MKIGEHEVFGISCDVESRCSHYHSTVDIVAIRFYCCNKWYSCYSCHQELSDHAAKVWPEAQWNAHAILCGACGNTLSIQEYTAGGDHCPHCHASFNPGCKHHKHLYFET